MAEEPTPAPASAAVPRTRPDTGLEARIARIERGLVAPIQVEGRTVVEHVLAERMAHHGVPGLSIALIDGGEVAWARAYGLKDVGTGEPVTTETLFQAASISKPVAVMGMLRLVEDGRLRLDADVRDHLASWSLPPHEFDQPVTLRRLASHTAGTTVHPPPPGRARPACCGGKATPPRSWSTSSPGASSGTRAAGSPSSSS